MTITTTAYGTFEEAFDYFNQELFGGKLWPCLITLQRKKNTGGYYSPHRFKGRVNKQDRTDEIALNPELFAAFTDEYILSILVHEMTHYYQRIYGNPGRGRYHNREWATLMIERGLIPSSTGDPEGKRTGDKMSHYIKEGGKFQKACQKLLATGFRLHWEANNNYTLIRRKGGSDVQADQPKNDRIKFTCLTCGLNAWAKPSAVLICGVCALNHQSLSVMQAPEWDDAFSEWTNEELAQLALVNGG